MPRKEGQKRTLLVLLQILARETDERHPLSGPQIVEKLKEKGIEAERKSVYDDLNTLNEKVKAQGGEVIGINTETLDGNQQGMDAAKKLLETTGASYRNIYFASGSEAGKFALNIMAFPTTYVFDRDGNVVGQPLLGGIDKEENLAALQKNIDAALAKDSAK